MGLGFMRKSDIWQAFRRQECKKKSILRQKCKKGTFLGMHRIAERDAGGSLCSASTCGDDLELPTEPARREEALVE
jgi:hypothetical protein